MGRSIAPKIPHFNKFYVGIGGALTQVFEVVCHSNFSFLSLQLVTPTVTPTPFLPLFFMIGKMLF